MADQLRTVNENEKFVIKHRYSRKAMRRRILIRALRNTFLFTETIVLAVLFFLYIWLRRYEAATPYGAFSKYLDLLAKKDWNTVYDNYSTIFPQFNTREDYCNYLENMYGYVDFSQVTYEQQDYSDESFIYYNLSYNGTTISTVELCKDHDGVWQARTTSSLQTYTFDVVDTNAKFYANNVLIDDLYLRKETDCIYSYYNLHNLNDCLNVHQYVVEGFVNAPTITADPGYIAVHDALKNYIYVGYEPDSEEKEVYTGLIKNVASAYSRYISEDGTFYNLRIQLHPDTEFYDAISSFDNSWFSTHDSYDFQNMEIYDLVKLDDDTFMGTIEFDYVVKIFSSNKTSTYHNIYQLCFKKVNGTYLCTNLVTAN